MSEAAVFRQKAEMFEERAQGAADPISRQHYREMAAHYRRLLVEHLDEKSYELADWQRRLRETREPPDFRQLPMLHALGGLAFRRQLVGQFPVDNLAERDVSQRGTGGGLHERTVAQAELPHASRNNVNQELLIRDHLSCVLQELGGHIS